MGNWLLRESLLGILLFFWEVLKQIQVRAWFLLPAVSNQNLELFHILGWWTQRKQLFVWGLLEYKDLDTYRVDRNDGLPRDLEPKMVINLWYILCIFVNAYIYIYTHLCACWRCERTGNITVYDWLVFSNRFYVQPYWIMITSKKI